MHHRRLERQTGKGPSNKDPFSLFKIPSLPENPPWATPRSSALGCLPAESDPCQLFTARFMNSF